MQPHRTTKLGAGIAGAGQEFLSAVRSIRSSCREPGLIAVRPVEITDEADGFVQPVLATRFIPMNTERSPTPSTVP